MPRVLDLSRNNCLKVKENKGKKLFFLLFYFSNIWVLGWVNQPSRQQDRDRLRRDRRQAAQCSFAPVSIVAEITFISVYLSHISGR
jgi:hypothetical protein